MAVDPARLGGDFAALLTLALPGIFRKATMTGSVVAVLRGWFVPNIGIAQLSIGVLRILEKVLNCIVNEFRWVHFSLHSICYPPAASPGVIRHFAYR